MRSSIIILSLLLATSAGAQGLFDLGLKGGVNQDDLRTGLAHTPLIGGHGGAFVRVKPPILPGGQAEVLVSTLGTTVRVGEDQLDLRTASLQVPLFLVLALGPVELHAGGYYDRYLTKQIAAGTEYSFDGGTLQAGDLADDGAGLLGGLGLRLGHFYAGARYLHGMQDLGSGPVLQGVRNRQVQAYIGFGLFKPAR